MASAGDGPFKFLPYQLARMKTVQILTFLSLAAPAVAAAGLKVDQYEGPTECEDESKVKLGDYVDIHYIGTIDESSETGEKGKKFDSSVDVEHSFEFQIGEGEVIRGWEEGLLGLCKGAKVTLVIPPEMAYGSIGHFGDEVPGGATLNYDVEVMKIRTGSLEIPNFFAQIDLNADGFLDESEIAEFFEKVGKPVPENLMELQDKDGDGKISWDEFIGPKGQEPPSADADAGETDSLEIPLFAQIDLNGDGFLDKPEITEFFDKMGQSVPEDLWGHEDKNGDGRISWNEFTGPKGTEPPSAREDL
jgi:Ca2+-binding EF-hand superfamily protein